MNNPHVIMGRLEVAMADLKLGITLNVPKEFLEKRVVRLERLHRELDDCLDRYRSVILTQDLEQSIEQVNCAKTGGQQ